MTPAEILRGARVLLDRREAWTQGAYYRDADGTPNGGETACRCLMGALYTAAGQTVRTIEPIGVGPAITMLREAAGLSRSPLSRGIVNWNDDPDRTHGEVLRALDRAIEIAEKEAA